jgi:hypothetical protein
MGALTYFGGFASDICFYGDLEENVMELTASYSSWNELIIA